MAGVAAERVLQKLDGVKGITKHPEDLGAWVARCPAHDDTVQSLHISERADGSVGLHCHAGCDKFVLLSHLGLTLPDLFLPKSTKKQILATYDYRTLDGALLYQVVRFWPKEFRQRRRTASGEWAWDLGPLKGKRVPYRLPQLKGQALVVVVEGEKDADKLWALGIPATTNSGGAKKWGQSETKALKQAGVLRVIVLPDNDPPGLAHAMLVGTSVKEAGLAVNVIELPHLAEHGDVSDWLGNGGTKDDLLALMQATPYVLPSGAAPVPAPAPEVIILPDALPNPLKYNMTHAGAADAFCDRFGHLLRFDHVRQKWYVWDQHRWRLDEDEAVHRMALDHARRWTHEVTDAATDSLDRNKWTNFTTKLEQRPQLQSLLWFARSHQIVKVSGLTWDTDPWLLCVKNGVLNLRTGELRDGHPMDEITLQAGVAYDPEAQCPKWLTFLSEIFGTTQADTEVIEFVRQFCGYLLSGITSEQIVVFCHGKGRNGKGRLLHAVRGVLGDYSAVLPFSSLISKHGADQASNDLAAIQGKRLVTASEINEGTRLNEARIKALTGEDPITARFLYKEFGTFEPVAKFVLSVNHKPIVKDDSVGFWRRVRLIPFLRQFDGTAQDKGLDAKLQVEWPGILTWALAGCTAWRQAGQLPEPETVKKETKDYQKDSEPLGDFLDACTVESEDDVVGANQLFKAYLHWCEDTKRSKEDRLTSTAFGVAMSMKFKKKREKSGVYYEGVRLTADVAEALIKQGGGLF
jgi:putative DNA primase/helicase